MKIIKQKNENFLNQNKEQNQDMIKSKMNSDQSYNLNYDFFLNFLSFTYLCNKSLNLNKQVVREVEKFKVAVNNLVSWKTSFVQHASMKFKGLSNRC